MPRSYIRALFAFSNVVELSISTSLVLDGCPGQLKNGRLHLRLGDQRCSLLTANGEHTTPLGLDDCVAILERVRLAMAVGSGQIGTDTAIGRDITTVQLTWWRPEDTQARQIRWDLNHHGERGDGPVAIQNLLIVWEPFLPEQTTCSPTWTLVRSFFRAPEPAPGFDDGLPVAYPHPGVPIPFDGGLWVRVGQHGKTRGLYRICAAGWYQLVIQDAHGTTLASGSWNDPPQVPSAFAIAKAWDNRMTLAPLSRERLYIQRVSKADGR